jgi:hypothetical protein
MAALHRENARLRAAPSSAALPPGPLAAAAAAAASAAASRGIADECRTYVRQRIAALRAGPAEAVVSGRRVLLMNFHPDKAPCPAMRPLWTELTTLINTSGL